jgi:glycosyltransferase involved in cell wall biosynthesis
MNGLAGITKNLTAWMEWMLIRFSDAVITVSNGIAEEYVRLYKIAKPALVLNCPQYKDVVNKNLFREELGISHEQTIFLYQGAFIKGRGIEVLLETFAGLDAKFVIVFMGYGQLEGLIKEGALVHNNIYFYPAVAPSILLDYTSSADFGISTIENMCLSYYYCLPNKMFEYLMAGLPVIVSNLHEMKRVVEQNRVGVVAEVNSAEGLRQAIRRAELLDKATLRENINKIRPIYSWEVQERTLLTVYSEL